MNAENRAPGQSLGRAPSGPGAADPVWREAVGRVLAEWLLSGIDGAGLWKALLADDPRMVGATAVRGVGHPVMSCGLPRAVGDQEGAAQRPRTPGAGTRAEVGEPSDAPRE